MEGPERRCPKGIEAKFPSCIVFSLPKHCNGRPRPRGVFCRERLCLRTFPSGQTGLSPDEMALRGFPSGQTRFSPDETASRGSPSGQNHDLPDGRSVRLAHQIHFGSQCATESVYWHLPAKVELKKSHFGKSPLTECTLRYPPCQSELAELQ